MPRDDKPATRPPTPTPVPEAMEQDAAAAYQQLLPEAKALPPESILPYRLDPDLAVINVRRAIRVVVAYRNDIPKHMPKIDIAALESIGKLALAAKYSALEADRTVPSERVISQKLAEARQHRATLMPIVAGLAATGYVSQNRYDDIARGRGPRDVAEDCVALAQVFREGGKTLDGKHSADPGTIAKAAALGSWLLENLRPAHALMERPLLQPAVDLRNRFATLLTRRYSILQAVAHYFHGDSYEDVAPPLMSRQTMRPRRESTPSFPAIPAPARSSPIAAVPA
jgi:hypothetical protein